MDEKLKQGLLEFAITFADVIGTEETHQMLSRLTAFAKECPDDVTEIKLLVEENPDVFERLLSREGIQEAKGLITTIEEYAPLFGMFEK